MKPGTKRAKRLATRALEHEKRVAGVRERLAVMRQESKTEYMMAHYYKRRKLLFKIQQLESSLVLSND